MVKFVWNDIEFVIANYGGGTLNENIKMHYHSKNSYELHFITGGDGMLYTDTKSYRLKKGNFFVTGPNISHSQTANKENPVTDIFLYIQKGNDEKNSTMASAFIDTHFCFVQSFEYETATKILTELNEKKVGYETVVAGLMMKLLTDISRLYLPMDFKESEKNENLNDKRFVIIESMFMHQKNLTLTELSEKLGLCERQTERLLKKYYGKTFRQKKKEAKSV